ncbi:hypothetical protein GH714_019948 [Hevea brasiliensis]|uniref:Cytochrome P450 n=1 Tax=Hevea brasiliensis TaxID=3981 RepID=A0A6A6L0F3_HEVBR|nr:hypothetical protein GH714_019948 [Hevea brasiliensis]
MGALADKYGPIFTIRVGVHTVLLVSSSEVAKELFTANDVKVTFRPALVAAKLMGYNYALFPFNPGGPYWREARKISISELLSNRRPELLKHIRIGEVETFIKELYKAWKDRKTVEMKQWFSDLNLNVLLRIIIGKKYFGAGAVGDEKKGRRFQEGITMLFHYLGTLVLRDAVPFLGWMDVGGHEKAMKKTARELDNVLENGYKSMNGREYDCRQWDCYSCYDMGTRIIAGQTVSIKKGPAIVKETLRLYPPAFIPGPRQFTEDCTIGGYHVPKNTWLMVNVWKIQRDPRVWPEPTEFKPERFLTTHKNFDVRGRNFELLPFGGGRRACPAASYGLHIILLTLVTLLQAFEISTPTDAAIIDMTPGIGLTNMKTTPLEVVVSPRLPPCCYE